MRLLWHFIRVCQSNGRLEVECRECGMLCWLNEQEIRGCIECIHCYNYGLDRLVISNLNYMNQ